MKMQRQMSFIPKAAHLKVASKQETSTNQEQTPYLKAVLSGNTRMVTAANGNTIANPDRDAALRYIRESRMLKKV